MERGTNLSLPIPFPWTLSYGSLPPAQLAADFVIAGSYLVLVIGYPLGLVWSGFTRPELLRRRSVLIACVCIGIPYAHHALVRAGESHLAQCIQPLLLGLFALPYALGSRRRILSTLTVWGALGLAAIVVAWGVHPELTMFGRRAGADWEPFEVTGDRLRLPAIQARSLAGLETVVQDQIADDEPLFIAPFRAGYYPLLRKASPVWDIYMLWPAPVEYQEQMIRTLEEKGVNWALIVHEYLLEDPRSAFARTHPKVMRYLTRNFEWIQAPELPLAHRLYRRRAERPTPAGSASTTRNINSR
jgi:hypothetical protein